MPVAVEDHGNAYLLALLVANSATFRTVVNKDTIASALTKIYYPWANEDSQEGDVERPNRAVIVDDSDFGEEAYEIKARGVWWCAGSYQLEFDFVVPGNQKIGRVNEYAWFTKQVKTILLEMRELAGNGQSVGTKTHLDLRGHRRTEGPWEIPPDEETLHDPSQGGLKSYWHAAYECFYW